MAVMNAPIAVLNAGSSSIKFAVFAAHLQPMFKGQVEQIGVSPKLRVVDSSGLTLAQREWTAEGFDHAAATAAIVEAARDLLGESRLGAVGHRVAHGGLAYSAPVRVDAAVIDKLTQLVPLAPLHQPHNLAPIRTIAKATPDLPQVACFDTAFHRTQPAVAQMFGLPRGFYDEGVRRYGFHGLSYEYICSRLEALDPALASGRVIIAHLGNGASLCAVRNLRSVATTMAFTALDGLLMGTRCGALDPGVVLFLMQSKGMDAAAIETLLYKKSGLLGVSGVSADMRQLRGSSSSAAAEAIALFVYRVAREIGSMAAALGGADAVVFTGGIGENDAATRSEIAAASGWLGLKLDPQANAGGQGRISAAGSSVAAWVVPTNEELMIASHTRQAVSLVSA
jgi:acetate kinase